MDKKQNKLKIKEPNELEKSYFAGLVDGEGSFFVDKRLNAWKFSIGMSDLTVIEKFKKSFNLNNLNISEYKDKRSKKNTTMYSVSLGKSQALQLALMLYPYLIVKKDVALKVMLDLIN